MNKILSQINGYALQLATERAPFTNVIGLARSILAMGTLLTLMANPVHYFFNRSVQGVYYNPLLDLETFPLNKLNFFFLFGIENAAVMKWIAIILLLGVISGYLLKITSVLHWWIAISFMLSSSVLDGGDQIAVILSFFLIFICWTDPRKNHWLRMDSSVAPSNIVAVVAIWVIRLQMAVVYFHASVGKFSVTEWFNGTALYYWLNHSSFGITSFWRPLLDPILSNSVLLPLITYGVLVLELSLFLALTASMRYRKRLFPIALFFHFSIVLFHGIFSFFFSMAAGLLLYMLPTYEDLDVRSYFKKLTMQN